MLVENILFDSALVIFSFYIVMRIVYSTIRTCCMLVTVRNLESAAIDFIKNQLPALLKNNSQNDFRPMPWIDEDDPCETCCGCSRRCCGCCESRSEPFAEASPCLSVVKKED